MAEGARLESVYTGNRIEGSNPSPSASSLFTSVRRQFGYKYLLDFVQRLLQVGDKVLDILNADG